MLFLQISCLLVLIFFFCHVRFCALITLVFERDEVGGRDLITQDQSPFCGDLFQPLYLMAFYCGKAEFFL